VLRYITIHTTFYSGVIFYLRFLFFYTVTVRPVLPLRCSRYHRCTVTPLFTIWIHALLNSCTHIHHPAILRVRYSEFVRSFSFDFVLHAITYRFWYAISFTTCSPDLFYDFTVFYSLPVRSFLPAAFCRLPFYHSHHLFVYTTFHRLLFTHVVPFLFVPDYMLVVPHASALLFVYVPVVIRFRFFCCSVLYVSWNYRYGFCYITTVPALGTVCECRFCRLHYVYTTHYRSYRSFTFTTLRCCDSVIPCLHNILPCSGPRAENTPHLHFLLPAFLPILLPPFVLGGIPVVVCLPCAFSCYPAIHLQIHVYLLPPARRWYWFCYLSFLFYLYLHVHFVYYDLRSDALIWFYRCGFPLPGDSFYWVLLPFVYVYHSFTGLISRFLRFLTILDWFGSHCFTFYYIPVFWKILLGPFHRSTITVIPFLRLPVIRPHLPTFTTVPVYDTLFRCVDSVTLLYQVDLHATLPFAVSTLRYVGSLSSFHSLFVTFLQHYAIPFTLLYLRSIPRCFCRADFTVLPFVTVLPFAGGHDYRYILPAITTCLLCIFCWCIRWCWLPHASIILRYIHHSDRFWSCSPFRSFTDVLPVYPHTHRFYHRRYVLPHGSSVVTFVLRCRLLVILHHWPWACLLLFDTRDLLYRCVPRLFICYYFCLVRFVRVPLHR